MPKWLAEEKSKQIFWCNFFTSLGTEIEYFTLFNAAQGKVLQASSVSSIVLRTYNDGSDNQLWYFDTSNSQLLRNKAFPDKVKICLYNQVVSKCHLLE